jgi:hypothetical protein
MAVADPRLEAVARRAYERGRVLRGLRRAAVVVPMAGLSLIACGHPTATWIDAGVLAAFVVLFEWRGQSLGRGSRIGLWAGLPPLVLPVAIRTTGHFCSADLCDLYPAMCLVGGVLGGVLLVQRGSRGLDAPGLAAAGLVAGLAGFLGCMVAGFGGLIGLVLGLGLGAAPLLALRRA